MQTTQYKRNFPRNLKLRHIRYTGKAAIANR